MITEEGTAVILVEQHAEIALSLTEHAVLLERGAIVHRARSQDLLKDHATLDRYIGLRVTEGKPKALRSHHRVIAVLRLPSRCTLRRHRRA